jgi:cytidylate kinase
MSGAEEANTRIAIDGPAGSGKTTTGKLVATRFGFRFFDTGIMYRAATRMALFQGFALTDEATIVHAIEDGGLEFVFDDAGDVKAFVLGVDETDSLRSPEVDHGVSEVSALPVVRQLMVQMQRDIAGDAQIVMVGRDIGTVVLPDAELKIYLTASAEERARRRFEQNRSSGIQQNFDEMVSDLKARDVLDSEREASPLRPADDSISVTSDGKSLEEVVDEVVQLVKAAE